MIQGTDDTRYAFVNGIIRAREARMLTRGHFDRLIAGNMNIMKTILADSSYGGYEDLLAGMDAEEQSMKDFLKQHCITPEVLDLVQWPEQMHNLKITIKEGTDSMRYTGVGNDVETWLEVQDIIARYALNKDPFTLSTQLDRILCKRLFDTARFCPFFYAYYQLYMDLENIRSFFRARQFRNSHEIFTKVYLPYGKMSLAFFLDSITMELDHLSKAFFTTPYVHLVDRGGVYLEQHHSFLRLERLIEEARMDFLISTRRMAFGVEPLFGYYNFKMAEIRKLQQVYWGKLNEVAIEDLKESIPDVW